MTAQLQCAVVHSIGYAHSHIAGKGAQIPAQSKNNESLKSLSSKVLRRTLSRTLSAQCREEPRTLHAHYRAENDLPRTLQKSGKVMPSPVALSWLHEHRQRAKAAGWTMRELYRRNKSRGICWCSLWDKPFFKAYLHDDGVIEMECVIAGRDVIQTARPMTQRPEKTKGGNPN
jgi:hypothetical protein